MKRRTVLAGATILFSGCSVLGGSPSEPTATAPPTPTPPLPDQQPSRYLEALRRPGIGDDDDVPADLPDGASGHPFDLLGATFESGTLTVTGRMAPTSLYPISETLDGLEEPFFIHHEWFPAVETLVPEVADCNGAIIARRTIKRAWIDRFWSDKTTMTVGDYVDRKMATHQGCRELDVPPEYDQGVPQREWTCEDWMEANPELRGDSSVSCLEGEVA